MAITELQVTDAWHDVKKKIETTFEKNLKETPLPNQDFDVPGLPNEHGHIVLHDLKTIRIDGVSPQPADFFTHADAWGISLQPGVSGAHWPIKFSLLEVKGRYRYSYWFQPMPRRGSAVRPNKELRTDEGPITATIPASSLTYQLTFEAELSFVGVYIPDRAKLEWQRSDKGTLPGYSFPQSFPADATLGRAFGPALIAALKKTIGSEP
jgi:hypothetical protein